MTNKQYIPLLTAEGVNQLSALFSGKMSFLEVNGWRPQPDSNEVFLTTPQPSEKQEEPNEQ